MRCPRAGEVRGLTSPEDWDRARRAYRTLVEGHDPVADLVHAGALDLRPGRPVTIPVSPHVVIVAGPDDLRELRAVVERALGVGTWPAVPVRPGRHVVGIMTLERPGPVLGFLSAMEGLIEQRSPWRTWRTVVDSLASEVARLDALTLDACVLEG